jgi:hypothetical protein
MYYTIHINFIANWVCFHCICLCSTTGRCKHMVSSSYSLHSQTSSERLNHVPSSRCRQKRGSRFVVRAEAVSYSFVFLFFLYYCLLISLPFWYGFKFSNGRISIPYLVSREMLVNLKSRVVSILYFSRSWCECFLLIPVYLSVTPSVPK